MKVLTVFDKGYPVSGGAQLTQFSFLKKMSQDPEYDCSYADIFTGKRPPSYEGVRFFSFEDVEGLRLIINRLKPDVIITGLNIIHDCARIARSYNIPLIAYLDSYEYMPYTAKEKEKWKVIFGKELPSDKQRRFALKEADIIITNSLYLKNRLKKTQGAVSRVLCPEFDPDDFIIGDLPAGKQEYITGICGYPHKGADIFYELAKIFKTEKFLIPGSVHVPYSKRFNAQKNIIIIPYASAKKFLKMSKIVLVPSQWPEPFGRIAVEAMANGIPVLASFTGGLKEIVGASSLGVRKFRNVSSWQRSLERLLSSKEAYELNVKEGKRLTERFLRGESTKQLDGIIKGLVKKKKPDFSAKKTIALCGKKDQKTAISLFNSNWFDGLKKEGSFSVVGLGEPKEFCSKPIDYFLHHDYTRDFKDVSLPDEGKFVAVRTWDFGSFPRSWVEKINRECDRLLVYSKWVRQQAIKSGVSPRRVRVFPQGIDPRIFTPSGRKMSLRTDKKFKFVFSGATVYRKGIDVLLKAYGMAFTCEDNVSLVIKDHTKDVFYSGINYKKEISRLIRNKRYPELIYIDEYYSPDKMAALFRACDAGVYPYRSEGFSLSILETLACGTPCIVPGFGACLDFCSRDNSFLMPVKRVNLPVVGEFMINTLGFTEEVDEVDFCEVDPGVLAKSLRKTYDCSREQLRKMSDAAVKTAHQGFTWEHSMDKLKTCLSELFDGRVPVRLQEKRALKNKERKHFKLAKRLYLKGV